MRKILNINHKNTHINTIRIKENKQLNVQQKQNYPDSVASYDTQPGNDVGLFYNSPEHHTGRELKRKELKGDTQKYYEIHTMNSEKAIGLYTFPGYHATT